jgi:hypothetical protein
MAREGIASFDEGWSSYHNAMRQYHREYRGQSVATYAREKAQEKARRYNTRLSPPSDDDSREGA